MKMLVTKIALATSVALATLIVAVAVSAQPQWHQAASEAYNVQANPNYGFGSRVTVHPNDVVSGNRVIGRDPDPFIRGEILRHYHSGWPD